MPVMPNYSNFLPSVTAMWWLILLHVIWYTFKKMTLRSNKLRGVRSWRIITALMLGGVWLEEQRTPLEFLWTLKNTLFHSCFISPFSYLRMKSREHCTRVCIFEYWIARQNYVYAVFFSVYLDPVQFLLIIASVVMTYGNEMNAGLLWLEGCDSL